MLRFVTRSIYVYHITVSDFVGRTKPLSLTRIGFSENIACKLRSVSIAIIPSCTGFISSVIYKSLYFTVIVTVGLRISIENIFGNPSSFVSARCRIRNVVSIACFAMYRNSVACVYALTISTIRQAFIIISGDGVVCGSLIICKSRRRRKNQRKDKCQSHKNFTLGKHLKSSFQKIYF